MEVKYDAKITSPPEDIWLFSAYHIIQFASELRSHYNELMEFRIRLRQAPAEGGKSEADALSILQMTFLLLKKGTLVEIIASSQNPRIKQGELEKAAMKLKTEVEWNGYVEPACSQIFLPAFPEGYVSNLSERLKKLKSELEEVRYIKEQ